MAELGPVDVAIEMIMWIRLMKRLAKRKAIDFENQVSAYNAMDKACYKLNEALDSNMLEPHLFDMLVSSMDSGKKVDCAGMNWGIDTNSENDIFTYEFKRFFNNKSFAGVNNENIPSMATSHIIEKKFFTLNDLKEWMNGNPSYFSSIENANNVRERCLRLLSDDVVAKVGVKLGLWDEEKENVLNKTDKLGDVVFELFKEGKENGMKFNELYKNINMMNSEMHLDDLINEFNEANKQNNIFIKGRAGFYDIMKNPNNITDPKFKGLFDLSLVHGNAAYYPIQTMAMSMAIDSIVKTAQMLEEKNKAPNENRKFTLPDGEVYKLSDIRKMSEAQSYQSSVDIAKNFLLPVEKEVAGLIEQQSKELDKKADEIEKNQELLKETNKALDLQTKKDMNLAKYTLSLVKNEEVTPTNLSMVLINSPIAFDMIEKTASKDEKMSKIISENAEYNVSEKLSLIPVEKVEENIYEARAYQNLYKIATTSIEGLDDAQKIDSLKSISILDKEGIKVAMDCALIEKITETSGLEYGVQNNKISEYINNYIEVATYIDITVNQCVESIKNIEATVRSSDTNINTFSIENVENRFNEIINEKGLESEKELFLTHASPMANEDY